jgi:hypothetical protein
MRSGTIVFVEAVATTKSDPTLLKMSPQCIFPSRDSARPHPEDAEKLRGS